MALRFEELIDRYHDEIFGYLWRLLREARHQDGAMDVEDLVQEVYLRAYKSFTSLRPNSNHRAWLYKIATNCAYTRLRLNNRHNGSLALNNSVEDFAAANDCLPRSESIDRRLRVSVSNLPEKQKICVTLRYLQGLSYAEIAEIVGCSEESARANVYQAIHRLRAVLREKT